MRAILNIGVLAFLLVAGAAAADTTRTGYVVIVNPGIRQSRLDRKFLAEIFLGHASRWPDDTPIRPVDLASDARARTRFSQEILARSVESVRNYWQQRIFSGQGLPPPELANDESVVSYVASHPGAVGYVAAGVALDGVTAVELN